MKEIGRQLFRFAPADKVSDFIVDKIMTKPSLVEKTLKLREERLLQEQERAKIGLPKKITVNTFKTGVDIMHWPSIPFTAGLSSFYGVYDFVSMLEGFKGEELGMGDIYTADRWIFGIAGATPFLPAPIIRAYYIKVWRQVEDKVKNISDQSKP